MKHPFLPRRSSLPLAPEPHRKTKHTHMNLTFQDIQSRKAAGTPITAITCYDYPAACWMEAAQIDIVLVGDSVGTNILGYASETEVTLDDMAHHLRAVRRGIRSSYLLVDLPYNTYKTPDSALTSARTLVAEGADGVKLEGFIPEIIKHLVQHDIQVIAHLGLMPQLHSKKSLQARTADSALELLHQAIALQDAGAWGLLLEVVPEEISKIVSQRLNIPTIGIGAGRFTDGQVLIMPDMLGFHDLDFRHNQKFADLGPQAIAAIAAYAQAVREHDFPDDSHVRHIAPAELTRFLDRIDEVPPTREGT